MTTTFNASGLYGITVKGPDHECDAYCHPVCIGDDYIEVGVNVAQANVLPLLALLGLCHDGEDVWCGSHDAAGLRDRVDLALMAIDVDGGDDGLDAYETHDAWGPGVGPKVIDCGRRAGYLTEKLVGLREVCEQAISLGVDVVWG